MKNSFSPKFNAFLVHLKVVVPQPQYEGTTRRLEDAQDALKPGQTNPYINPGLSTPEGKRPQQWWRDSFGFYLAIDLAPSGTYGPFFRLESEETAFWPQIGNPEDPASETGCFFAISAIRSVEQAERDLWMRAKDSKWCFRFHIHAPDVPTNAQLFLGSVSMGCGFQMNPNRIANAMIQKEILAGRVEVAEVENGKVTDKWRPYTYVPTPGA